MARRPRIQLAGGTFHVCSRGVLREPIFFDDEDREFFLARLGKIAEELGWRVLAYCLMGNHYHLVIETPEPNLSKGMHRLNLAHARRFNRRHDRTGHLFEARFWSALVETQQRFEALLAYVAQNPVRARIARRPENWRWNSFRQILRGEKTLVDLGRLLQRFAGRAINPLRAYLSVVRAEGEEDPAGNGLRAARHTGPQRAQHR